jgi:hypothetical protein
METLEAVKAVMTKIIDVCSLMLCSLVNWYQPLKMEVAGSSDMSVSFYQVTWCCDEEDCNLQLMMKFL